MIGAIFVYSPHGMLLMAKYYRGTMKRSLSEVFQLQVINNVDIRSPILTLGSTSFHHIRTKSCDNLWLVAVTRHNAQSAAVWEFLQHWEVLLEAYDLTKEEIFQSRFMLCHEMLDLMLDISGMPRNTDPTSVIASMGTKPQHQPVSTREQQRYRNLTISQSDSHISLHKPTLVQSGSQSSLPSHVSAFLKSSHSNLILPNSNEWKSKLTKGTSDINVDVVEYISILVSKDGSILKSFVDGAINLQCEVSQPSLCSLGLSDYLIAGKSENNDHNSRHADATSGIVLLSDCHFHQSVSLEKFNNDGTIEFQTQPGTLELMTYHVRDNLHLPFKVTPTVVNVSQRNLLHYTITVKSLFPMKLTAKEFELHIPVPPGTLDCRIDVSNGICKFIPEENAMVWKFARYAGLTENTLNAFTVPSRDTTHISIQQWPRPPITLNFQIMMFSNSGLLVRYISSRANNNKNRAAKWIKYYSKSGSYEIRY